MEQLHYNAFISYRHHPDDIRVAEQIHRCLERFHVPAAIRKRCGKIQRLFRDKDELPITSNLTEDITKALNNADYLIVICSEHTRESLWVQREIELFLTTHDRSKVLTVLASGEPRDTIPEILQYEEITDPVTGQTVRQSVEPLSCDWRLPKRKRMREELPRLAAALLGCAYDELRQRQRQYRNRRMFIGLSAALALCAGLTAYFLYTNVKIQQANDQLEKANQEINQANQQLEQANDEIQANLSQALINQSQYLASSAQERLTAGDRLTAISLAMAALPQDSERPYVAQAELALAQALGLYSPKETISAVGALTADTKISSFCVSQDGELLFALDTSGQLYAWNTRTFHLVFQLSFYGSPIDIRITADDNLLVDFNTSITCIDRTGKQLWKLECQDMAQLSDGTLLALHSSALVDPRIDYVDPITGEVLHSIPLPAPEEGDSISSFSADTYPTEAPVLLTCASTGLSWNVYALNEDRLTLLCHCPIMPYQVSYDRQGNVLLLKSDGTGMYNGRVGELWYSEPAQLQILCIDPATGAQRWQHDFKSYFYSTCRTLCQIPGKDLILCQYANEFLVLDLEGNLAEYGRATAVPVVTYTEEDEFWGVLQDGNIFFYHYDDTVISMQVLLGNITHAAVGGAYFISTDTNQIIAYRSLSDAPQETILESYSAVLTDYQVYGDRLVTVSISDVSIYDLTSRTLLCSIPVDNCAIAGTDPTQSTLYLMENRDQLIQVDLATGEQTTTQIPAHIDETDVVIHTRPQLFGDSLYYILNDSALYLASYTPSTDTYTVYKDAPMEYQSCTVLGVYNGSVYLWMNGEQQVLQIAQTGEAQVFSHQFMLQPAAVASEDDLFFADSEGILSVSGNVDSGFASVKPTLCGMKLLENGIALLYIDGTLEYRDMDGKLIGTTSLLISDIIRRRMETERNIIKWYETPDSELLVSVAGYATLIHVDTWQPRANFSGCMGYQAERDSLVISKDQQLVTYPRYTTAQVLEMAQEALNGFTLSKDVKDEYGLN